MGFESLLNEALRRTIHAEESLDRPARDLRNLMSEARGTERDPCGLDGIPTYRGETRTPCYTFPAALVKEAVARMVS